MILSVDEVKSYLKIDNNDEDKYITLIIAAAETFIKDAVGKKFDERNDLIKVVSLFLISDMYEKRSMTTDKQSEQVRGLVQMLITQIACS